MTSRVLIHRKRRRGMGMCRLVLRPGQWKISRSDGPIGHNEVQIIGIGGCIAQGVSDRLIPIR